MKTLWLHRAAALVLALGACSAKAGAWRVLALEVQGRAAVSVEVLASAGSEQALLPLRLRLDQQVADGTRLRLPSDVRARLANDQGGTLVHEYGAEGELQVVASNDRRHDLRVLSGFWRFARAVAGALDTTRVAAGRGQAMSSGTEFVVGFDPVAGQSSFQVLEGRVEVTRLVSVEVAGTPVVTVEQLTTLRAGDPPLVLSETADDYLVRHGSFDQAVEAFEALARSAAKHGNAAARFNALLALGDVLRAYGRGADAAAAYQQALALVPGAGDGYWRAIVQGRLGDAWLAMNRYAQAAAAYRDSMAAHAVLPPFEGEDAVGDQRANLASAYLADGTLRCARAEADAVLASLDAQRAIANHPTRVAMLGVQADLALQLGRPQEAWALRERQLELQRRIGSPNPAASGLQLSEEMLSLLLGRGRAALALGRAQDAESDYRQALLIAESLFPGPHALQAVALNGLAETAASRGDAAEAMARLDEALERLRRAPPAPSSQGDALQLRGRLLLEQHRADEALPALRQARALFDGLWPDEGQPRFFVLLPMLARALHETGAPPAEVLEIEAAERSARAALSRREQACLR